jgi:hypothetical protein
LRFLVENIGFDDRAAKLHAHQLPVADAVTRKVRKAGRRRQRHAVGQRPADVHIDLRIFALVPLPAQIVPIGIGVVEKAPARHRVVVEEQAGIVMRQARLTGLLEKIGDPVGIAALPADRRDRRIGRAGRIHIETDQIGRTAVRLRVVVQCAERKTDRVAGMHGELQSPDRGVRAAELLRAAGQITVGAERGALGAQIHAVRERHVDHGRHVLMIEISAGEPDVTVALSLRLLRKHADRTAGAVSAEQGALWASQNFDSFDIEDPHHRTGRPRHEYVVDVETNAALTRCAATAADAANLPRWRGIAGTARALDIEVRRDRL